MAKLKLKDVGVPGLGSGVFHPKRRIQFRVRFLDTALNPLAVSDRLSAQVLRVGEIEWINHGSSFGIHSERTVEIVFEDDLINRAAQGLVDLETDFIGPSFVIAIDYLDGNDTVVRTHHLTTTTMVGLTFDSLDYATSSVQSTTKSITTLNADGDEGGPATNETRSTTYNEQHKTVVLTAYFQYGGVSVHFHKPEGQ